MADVKNTGTFDLQNHKTGQSYGYSIPSYSYCQEATPASSQYPNQAETEQNLHNGSIAPDANTHVFGFKAETIVVHNEGSGDIAIAYSVNWGIHPASDNTPDSVIVKGNSTIQLRAVKTEGVKVRHRNGAGPSPYVIQAW